VTASRPSRIGGSATERADAASSLQSIQVTIVAHDVAGAGGMERQLRALICGLLNSGVNVDIVSRTLDLPAHASLRWRRVRGPARPFPVAYPWFMLMATAMLLWKRRGVLHATGAIICNRSAVCTVHYVHDGGGGTIDRRRRATYAYRVNAVLARWLSRSGERLIYSSPSLSRVLVAVSKPLAQELARSYPARSSSIRVVENGVDLDRFRPDAASRADVRRALGIPEEQSLALFVGSNWRGKGAHIAVSALADAPSWHLAVVGDGEAAELLSLAEGLGVRPRLHLVAETPHPEHYFAAADAFVLPSAYESFSLAAFEAAAAGVPVLATNVGAIAEIVGAGGGVFIERTPESVARSLTALEADPGASAAMSARGRACAARFGWDAVVEGYVALYRESTIGVLREATVGSAT
jgi:glycosyltransferase involved in cell wall biosynthesis